jgi:6-pyruvoyltetrahydropterin/6-carboxytetrahydropterin synthase
LQLPDFEGTLAIIMFENQAPQAICRLVVQKDEHKFSCAHMSVFPDGTKERMHGHNFRLALAVEMPSIEQGPMLDFARLKAVLAQLCAELREHLLLPAHCHYLRIHHHDASEIDFELCGSRYVLPAQDVLLLPIDNVIVESLAAWLWKRVYVEIRDDLIRCQANRLEVSVTEAPGQGATYGMPLGG